MLLVRQPGEPGLPAQPVLGPDGPTDGPQAFRHLLEDRAFDLRRDVLSQVGRPGARREGDRPAFRLKFPGDQTQKRGLAHAVPAQEPDPLAGLDTHRDVLNQGRSPESERHVGQVQDRHPGEPFSWANAREGRHYTEIGAAERGSTEGLLR